MSRILVANAQPGAGASTIAAAIAYRLAHAGRAVRLERLDGDVKAPGDAEVFAAFEFAQASGQVMTEASLPADEADIVTVIEAAANADGHAVAGRLNAKLVLVSLDPTLTDADATVIFNHQRTSGTNALPEDRLLAAPTVARLIEASGARVLARSEDGDDAVCEHLVVGAISHDSADAHFLRYPRRAVVSRVERVDLALAAMLTQSECLILTGGEEPSPYILDRASATRQTTLLLAPEGTVETLRDIEGTFGTSPFAGEVKLERASALLAEAIDEAVLEQLAG